MQVKSLKRCAESFLKWTSRYLNFGDLTVSKIVLQNKIINKTKAKKDHENSAHRFEDNYLTHDLVKFLQDRIKPKNVGTPRVNTGY